MNSKDIIDTFNLYAPDSAGNEDSLANLTIQCIQNIFSNINILIDDEIPVFEMDNFKNNNSEYLKELLDKYNSDKATKHDYYIFYSYRLKPNSQIKLFEVGLGTNNEDVVSTMGANGTPGASVRAFRDYLNGPTVYGADIDSRILFSENKIETFYVDQLNIDTFNMLPLKELDILIDDGLHSIDANLFTIAYGIKTVKSGGSIIIEDIPENRLPFYRIIAKLIPVKNNSFFIKAKHSCMFIINID